MQQHILLLSQYSDFIERSSLTLKITALYDVDGKPYKLPPWTSRSEGAATIVTAMIDPRIEKSNGSYLHNNAIADEELHSHVLNRDNWHKLWELSEKLIGESFTF